MKVKYSYTMLHNWQDHENPMHRMGRENVTVSGEHDLAEFFRCLTGNSQLKHENGEPYLFITDIQVEIIG
jgi:hypothetical protein